MDKFVLETIKSVFDMEIKNTMLVKSNELSLLLGDGSLIKIKINNVE